MRPRSNVSLQLTSGPSERRLGRHIEADIEESNIKLSFRRVIYGALKDQGAV